MSRSLHPSLARLYTCALESEFLYIDETYTSPDDPLHENSFYALTAVQFKASELDVIRADLRDIVDGDYFHSTEALRTNGGQRVFEEMLKYFSDNREPSFITCNINLAPDDDLVQARRRCLKNLVEKYIAEVPLLRGLIFEARHERKDNNRDRSFLKHLRKEGLLTNEVGAAWVSPQDERLLWAPDAMCMAYRRARTHSDMTAHYFEEYLSNIARVYEF